MKQKKGKKRKVTGSIQIVNDGGLYPLEKFAYFCFDVIRYQMNVFRRLIADGYLNGDLVSPRFQINRQSYPNHTKLFLDTYHGRNHDFNANQSSSYKLLRSVTCPST